MLYLKFIKFSNNVFIDPFSYYNATRNKVLIGGGDCARRRNLKMIKEIIMGHSEILLKWMKLH